MVIYRAKKVRNQQPGELDGWSSTLCSPDGSAQANICPTPRARTSLSKGSTFETRTDSPTDSLMGPETPWIQALKNGSRVASSGLTRRGGRKHLAANSPSKKSVTGMSGSKQNIATSRADTDLVNRWTQENSSKEPAPRNPKSQPAAVCRPARSRYEAKRTDECQENSTRAVAASQDRGRPRSDGPYNVEVVMPGVGWHQWLPRQEGEKGRNELVATAWLSKRKQQEQVETIPLAGHLEPKRGMGINEGIRLALGCMSRRHTVQGQYVFECVVGYIRGQRPGRP